MAHAMILLVDDDPEWLRMAANVLRTANFGVVTATSPTEALAQLHNQPVKLAIIDIRLEDPADPHDYSGWLLSRSVGLKIPVIFFTMYDFDWREPQKAKTLGGVDKGSPVWREELLTLVRRVIRPVVYIAHANSPRLPEVEGHLEALGLSFSANKAHDDNSEIRRNFLTEAQRTSFSVILLTVEPPPGENHSVDEMRDRETLAYEWGYLASRNPKNLLVLREDGAHLPPHVDPKECLRFDLAGSWMNAFDERLRSLKMI